MKTIEVSDEMYESLIQLATEMVEQDKRGTRMPHLFQIRDWERIYDDNLNGDVRVFIHSDGDYEVIETLEDLKIYIESEDVEEPENLEEMWDDEYWWDLDDWVDENLPKLRKSSYSLAPRYINSFLTAKAAEEHLESNNYHYHQNADVYLNHAWRNPEAELVSKFLVGLLGKELYT
jgi:hypothetical protein